MYKCRSKRNSIAGVLLLTLFALYWCGITLFTHSHVVNGVIVVHSHPYSVEHTHTQGQLETIFYLSLLQTSGDVQACMDLPHWLVPLLTIVFVCLSTLPASPVSDVNSREPPSVLFLY